MIHSSPIRIARPASLGATRGFLFLPALVAIALGLFGGAARAKLEVKFELDKKTFMTHEPVTGTLELINRAGQEIVIDGPGPGRGWLDFRVIDGRQHLISPVPGIPPPKSLILPSGQPFRTKVMVNLGNPELAFQTSFIPNDGVGLARMEFIISEAIKAHPMALVHPERISDPRVREQIGILTRHHGDPVDYFVEKLSEGVGTIAAAFYPKPVIVRMSDFKTNEYAQLLGGRDFEPEEANPMLGFRGAARYAHPAYAEGFALECRAMKRVRDEMGFTNVRLMIPFCRRVEEGRRVLEAMAGHGLDRGVNGLEIYVMCEIPNNVLQIDAFSEIFDGFSIGSNDLTQLVLGVDRDSRIVAFDFDERDPGVLEMIRQAVEGARRNRRHSGICGQAPSDYPEIAERLVRLGIDSISLNPDTVIETTLKILDVEKDTQG